MTVAPPGGPTQLPMKHERIEDDILALSLPRGRRVGQPGHEAAKQYLLGRMREIGLLPLEGCDLELPYSISAQSVVGLCPVTGVGGSTPPPLPHREFSQAPINRRPYAKTAEQSDSPY